VAFFPGGTEVVIGDDPATALPGRKLPRGGTMVLGHNFDNVASYEQSIERGREFGWNTTWHNLSKLFALLETRNAWLTLEDSNRHITFPEKPFDIRAEFPLFSRNFDQEIFATVGCDDRIDQFRRAYFPSTSLRISSRLRPGGA
jgi:hypothetical protein